MKIAIFICGHLRGWEICKNNFIDTLYDKNHNIDVFVNTYHQVYRTDYKLHDEDQMLISLSENEIKKLFEDINVVNFFIENEVLGDAETCQMKKINKSINFIMDHEKLNGQYDLIVRTRFDIILHNKIDYEYVYNFCNDTNNVYAGKGIPHDGKNDMLGIGSSKTMHEYGLRNRVKFDNTNLDVKEEMKLSIVRLINKIPEIITY